MPLPGQGRRDHGTPTSTAVPTAALLGLGPSQAEPRVVGTVTDDHCGHPSLRSGSGLLAFAVVLATPAKAARPSPTPTASPTPTPSPTASVKPKPSTTAKSSPKA